MFLFFPFHHRLMKTSSQANIWELLTRVIIYVTNEDTQRQGGLVTWTKKTGSQVHDLNYVFCSVLTQALGLMFCSVHVNATLPFNKMASGKDHKYLHRPHFPKNISALCMYMCVCIVDKYSWHRKEKLFFK